jgi:hypothetical protein
MGCLLWFKNYLRRKTKSFISNVWIIVLLHYIVYHGILLLQHAVLIVITCRM